MEDFTIFDPTAFTAVQGDFWLRRYQSDTIRVLYDRACRHDGLSYAVMFPRQSGKNELQARLEYSLSTAYHGIRAHIIKAIPTAKTQGKVSSRRFESAGGEFLFGEEAGPQGVRIDCISMQPNTEVVGQTADLLLEVDEAQDVPIRKFDKDVAPMTASTNATRIFWGTAWDDSTLLARELAAAGDKRRFVRNALTVSREVPAYRRFIEEKIRELGREHPVIRTQYFCEEITSEAGMFSPAQLEKMRGTHPPEYDPLPDAAYVFLIDIAGSDELSVKDRCGFGERRDATVLTICRVESDPENGSTWFAAARRYYRNVPLEKLKAYVSAEIEHWDPVRVLMDHTGLGCALTEYISRRFPNRCGAYDITASIKTKMAWGFIAMLNAGQWREYAADPVPVFPADPKRDSMEVESDPRLLQERFFREMRACRMDTAAGSSVRWGVPEGRRDLQSGEMIHDDLVLSAALSTLESEPVLNSAPDAPVEYVNIRWDMQYL